MTQTENYQLPQWEAADPIKRADFNAAMEALDAGVAGAQTTANTARNEAGAAQNTAQTAYTAAQGAQTTADAARTEAAAAQATADTAVAAWENQIVSGVLTATASLKTGDQILTYDAKPKLGFFTASSGTTLLLKPGVNGRVYFGSWSECITLSMNDSFVSVFSNAMTATYNLYYTLFY